MAIQHVETDTQRPASQTIEPPDAPQERIVNKTTGEITYKKYTRGKLLGKGGFAKCYELTSVEDKKIFASKITLKCNLGKPKQRAKLLSEIKIHRALRHDNIVQFEHVFEDQDCVYILLELCQNQTLNELVRRRRRLHPLEVQCYVVQILHALQYLHDRRYIHRDLKLGNLFLHKDMSLKLGDFGLAARLEENETKKKTVCGTPNYIAPEILMGGNGHSYEVDIWSLGVVIYALLTGKPPFETSDVKATYRRIKANQFSFPESIPIPVQARELIKSILKSDPTERPTIPQILAHPFLSSNPIPAQMGISTLACPPALSFLNNYINSDSKAIETISGSKPVIPQMPAREQMVASPIRVIGDDLPMQNQNFVKHLIKPYQQPDSPAKAKTELQLPDQGIQRLSLASSKQLQITNMSNEPIQDLVSTIPPSIDGKVQIIASNQNISITEPWIIYWIDYSSKYGIGYLLSNNTSGVYFNDSSKIILSSSGKNFEYMERAVSQTQETIQRHPINDYPDHLNKKVTLMLYFQEYLQLNLKTQPGPTPTQTSSGESGLIYVKKWLKAKRATIFRLSNKIIQVKFSDKTEILLSSENKMVVYINKQGEAQQFPLSSALAENQNQDMSKRLRYTKEILTSMFASQTQAKNTTGQPAI